MDRLVDHLFVFEGDGVVRDFPGNYSQYREWLKQQEPKEEEKKIIKPAEITLATSVKKKLSYKEQREFETLEKELALLEKERQEIYSKLSNEELAFEELQGLTARIGTIANMIDEKEMRWLELSENAS
jgi:ATP-binding cassette subfamily F protein uup